jgi:hypothetical protein
MLAQALTWHGSLFLVSSVVPMRLALLGWTGEGARPYTFRAHSLRVYSGRPV